VKILWEKARQKKICACVAGNFFQPSAKRGNGRKCGRQQSMATDHQLLLFILFYQLTVAKTFLVTNRWSLIFSDQSTVFNKDY
jgi:hypothetical protein